MTVHLKIVLAAAILSSVQLPAHAGSGERQNLETYKSATSKAKSARAMLVNGQPEIRSGTSCNYQGGPKTGLWTCR